jgi:hypothetical protein
MCSTQRNNNSVILQCGDMSFDLSRKAITELSSKSNPYDFARGLTELLYKSTNEAKVKSWGECRTLSDILNLSEHIHEDMMNSLRNIRS